MTRRTGALLTSPLELAPPMAGLSGLARFTFDSFHAEESSRSFDFVRLPEGLVQISLFVSEERGRQLARLWVAGPNDRPIAHGHALQAYRVWGVEFEAGAALSVLGVPLASLMGTPILLEDVWGAPARILAERMEACASSAAKLSLLQTELIARRLESDCRRGHLLAGTALRSIEGQSESIRVGALAGELGVSARQLQRIFADHIGLSPKRCAQVTRFRRAFELVSSPSPVDWASAAADLGYVDQSHLIDDFRDQFDETPERLRLQGDFVEASTRFGWLVTPKIAANDL